MGLFVCDVGHTTAKDGRDGVAALGAESDGMGNSEDRDDGVNE